MLSIRAREYAIVGDDNIHVLFIIFSHRFHARGRRDINIYLPTKKKPLQFRH